MAKDQTKQTVFAIVNLVNTEDQMRNTITYAADLAKHKKCDLILHPKHEESPYSFPQATEVISKLADTMGFAHTLSQQAPSFFTSIHRIAEKQQAVSIVIGVSEKITKKVSKQEFSDTMWDVANRSHIPIYLVPKKAKFDPASEITIAVDANRTIQKAAFLNGFTTKDTIVHLFIESTTDPIRQKRINWTNEKIAAYLSRHDISFVPTIAREEHNYSQHLMKFAAKKSKLLIIEVASTLDSDLKEHLQRVLFGKHQEFAVLLLRTEDYTLTTYR
ncbi:MAG: hypothetical protein NTX91_00305 [candidate division SR1 bacterium]|nr:hypothetical protein [candidate division SR1 bacterium]